MHIGAQSSGLWKPRLQVAQLKQFSIGASWVDDPKLSFDPGADDQAFSRRHTPNSGLRAVPKLPSKDPAR
jgi:hypothetical protein